MNPTVRRLALSTLFGATASALLLPVPRAGAYLWTGGSATSGNWSDAANWGADGAPISSSDTALVFTGGSRLVNTQDFANPFILNSLTFDANAGAFTFGGNGLDFRTKSAGSGSPNLNQNSAAAQTINNAVTLTNDLAVNVSAGAGQLTLTGSLSGSASLTKTGAGTLLLTGTASTYSRGTAILVGTLAFNGANALGNGSLGVNGGELRATANASLGQNRPVGVAAGAAGTISAAPGTNLTLAGDFSLYGDVTFGSAGQTGTVTVALQSGSLGANANIVVSAGTLQASYAGPTTLSLFTDNAASTTVATGPPLISTPPTSS